MIIGEYPCCNSTLTLVITEGGEGKFIKEKCPHCGEIVWHYLSRFEPVSYTDEQFKRLFYVDEENKGITHKY